MAAAKLVTRCPACRTAFRLVADQLRLRQGLVRCGQCDTVFDAREHLIEVPVRASAETAPAPAAASPETPPVTTTPPAAPAVTLAAALAHAERMQDSAQTRDQQAPFDPGYDPGYEVPALDSPTTMMSEPEPEPEPALPAGPAHFAAARPAAEDRLDTDTDTDTDTDDIADAPPAPLAETSTSPATPEPEAAPPPAVPWPTLDHAAFDDQPAPAPAPHSSLDPAAAFAPPAPTHQPSGAYSAPLAWPALKPTEAPPAPHVDAEAPATAGDDVEAEAPREADPTDLPPAPPSLPQEEPVPSASGFLRVADPTDPEAEAWAAQAREVIEHDLGVTPHDGTPDAVARETTTRHWLRQDAAAAPAPGGAQGPVFAPDFLRHARGRDAARTPGRPVSLPGTRRGRMRAAVVLLALAALVQATYLARSQIAGSIPVLRPVLEAACAPLGCQVPPWRDLDALRIETSQLQKQDEGTDVYQLAVTLRNQGRATTALPAIELVMTDLQDQLLLRRVLQPAEYLDAAQRGFATTGLRAGSELPVRVRFRTQQAVANYRVLIFYP
ncbi:DUF3426 domain-containing protein [Cupriavidus agavae]|uniref:Putative Zn finger-like uncharacterized protein n=1 Tax=Cupriavidus agavae TaxID=1001822 RepID=A0A4Q7S6X8_9BURK|nr:DUF3426 domain-containing protein [Cupriavidus agavae]RZT41102.1 putative Zn finger-like uncharacterized protein [Cupriavidus agavae]